MKLTERGLDPAYRDWSKRLAAAWDAIPEAVAEDDDEGGAPLKPCGIEMRSEKSEWILSIAGLYFIGLWHHDLGGLV